MSSTWSKFDLYMTCQIMKTRIYPWQWFSRTLVFSYGLVLKMILTQDFGLLNLSKLKISQKSDFHEINFPMFGSNHNHFMSKFFQLNALFDQELLTEIISHSSLFFLSKFNRIVLKFNTQMLWFFIFNLSWFLM